MTTSLVSFTAAVGELVIKFFIAEAQFVKGRVCIMRGTPGGIINWHLLSNILPYYDTRSIHRESTVKTWVKCIYHQVDFHCIQQFPLRTRWPPYCWSRIPLNSPGCPLRSRWLTSNKLTTWLRSSSLSASAFVKRLYVSSKSLSKTWFSS